jgi:hypothetical protein
MARIVLIALLVAAYAASIVVAVVSIDVDGNGGWFGARGWSGAGWAIMSVLLGAGTGQFPFALLSLLAIPIAIPFGYPEDLSGDPVFPVWVGAAYFALFSSGLITLAALVRRTVDARRRSAKSI